MKNIETEEIRSQLQALEEQISGAEGVQWESIAQVLDKLSADDESGLYGRACYYAAFYMLYQGRIEKTLEYLDQSVKGMIGTEEERELSRCYNMFGIIAHCRNNLVLAMEQYEKAREYAIKYNCTMDYNIAMGNLAEVFFRIGDYERAVQCYEECLREYEVDNNSNTTDIVNYRKIMASYGYCLVMSGRTEQADAVADTLLGMSCNINSELATRLSIYTFLAFLYYRKGQPKRGELVLRIAITSAMDLEQISSECDILLNLVHVLCETAQYEYLAELLHDLESKAAVEKNAGLLLQLLSVHIRYFGDTMDIRELRQNADMFFGVKAEYEKAGNSQILQLMDLRKRLQLIDERQKELEDVNSKLLYQVDHDGFSGLCNKGYLNRYLEEVFEEAVQEQFPISILFLDIDFFKQMNDYYGHQKGDECILALADSLKKCMPEEFLARYGGDEFVVVMRNRSEEYVQNLADALLKDIADKRIEHAASEISDIMTVTIGIMHEIPQTYNRVWDFLSAADVALYQQKKEMRGCARFFRE